MDYQTTEASFEIFKMKIESIELKTNFYGFQIKMRIWKILFCKDVTEKTLLTIVDLTEHRYNIWVHIQ